MLFRYYISINLKIIRLFGYSYDYYIIEINTKVERLRVGIREGTKTGLKHDVIVIRFKI